LGSVCLSVCQQSYGENYLTNLCEARWKNVARAKEEPIKVGRRSKSQINHKLDLCLFQRDNYQHQTLQDTQHSFPVYVC